MDIRKLFTGASIVAFCGVVGVAGVLMGCAPQATSGSSVIEAQTVADSSATKTMDEWGELYPLQYSSYHQSPIKGDGNTHGHYDLKQKLLAPVVRDGTKLIQDEEGNYAISGYEYDEESHRWVIAEDQLGAVAANEFKMGCYSCKSGNFNEIYEERGAQIFTQDPDQEFIDQIDGQVWDCQICHGDTAGSAPTSYLTYFNQIGRDGIDSLNSAERACGQCHNSLDYRHAITDQDAMDSFSAYRYGLDVDSLIQAVNDDDITVMDEEIGVKRVVFDHDDVEFAHTSPMADLGVTCVTCHMPESTDETSGETYTNHHASGSPLESEDSLEVCLTCHENQGIGSTEEMKQMVKDKQVEAAAAYDASKAKLDQARELLAKATADGVSDADLEQVRADYQKADAYLQHIKGGGNVPGAKVAHNPTATFDLAAKAGNLADGIVEDLG